MGNSQSNDTYSADNTPVNEMLVDNVSIEVDLSKYKWKHEFRNRIFIKRDSHHFDKRVTVFIPLDIILLDSKYY